MKKKEQPKAVKELLKYAGNYRMLTVLGLLLSAGAMVLGMVPYLLIWLTAKDLISVAPDWSKATQIVNYGWAAFGFSIAGIIIYFAALMCTHLAAFRTATNIRKEGMKRLLHAPIGYFDNHASGLLRSRLNDAAGETETLLAHNLADIVGAVAMFVSMVVLMLLFDWRMGVSCLIAAVISVLTMASMMGGKNAKIMAEYQRAQDNMSKAGTEYVRGIPVVKIFQQTVYSFRAFKESIEKYSNTAEYFTNRICKFPQSLNLTFTESAFALLVPVALFLAPRAVASGNFAEFFADFVFYAVFSAIISTALSRIMFAANGIMIGRIALDRINDVMDAPALEETPEPKEPKNNRITYEDVTFAYKGSNKKVLEHISFAIEPGQTVALVGPSGGGKTTLARLIPRFWDVSSGSVKVGDVDVRDMKMETLMKQIAFVFQNDRLFKTSILENVRAARPAASVHEVQEALEAAQCMDIIEKLPNGIHTVIGSKGTYLSGGEQQRIVLARAILKDAPIVVLDEATAFADAQNEALIQKALASLMKDRTVLMIAHRLSTVVNADNIIVLNGGTIEEKGTHTQLISLGGLYSRMWEEYQKAANWKIKVKKEG
ncbi:ABC transporter ATP-binding protein [Eubacterium oxidoreducens]|uniref:ATP-binding cassette, subfamily B n=1 Tax=Eubacterium oxidoreducens TaxID=1732 RepID=A0A1G6BIL4_EUBOX|nr:ABC transporter ATP-binding protein [Eubacterium oxidoreducens]SDB20492.1 ATP-binding cassette, subfamily B [Eubacterium oxidoreducens]